MCNAHNHEPWCNCGWGGENHSAGGTDSAVRSPRLGDYPSYVNQNARCPVCGASVYFYQSPDGGRVFFDEIGWPWPKHPCTDGANQGAIKFFTAATHDRDRPNLLFLGREFGWRPFLVTYLRKLPDGQLRLHGQFHHSDGRPALETYLDTVSINARYREDVEDYHQRSSGLPFFVREHFTEGYLEIVELNVLSQHAPGSTLMMRKENPIICVPAENLFKVVLRHLRR